MTKGISNWNRCQRNIRSPRAADFKKLRTKKREGAARRAVGVHARTMKQKGTARSAADKSEIMTKVRGARVVHPLPRVILQTLCGSG